MLTIHISDSDENKYDDSASATAAAVGNGHYIITD